jgi:hypothetical protein
MSDDSDENEDEGESSTSSRQATAQERREARANREDEDDHQFLDRVGLRRLRLRLEAIDDEKVRDLAFQAFREAMENPAVDNAGDLVEQATNIMVRMRDASPGDIAIRNTEYRLMALNAVVNRQPSYAASSLGIPLYDALKVVAWGMKDLGTATGVLEKQLGFPEWLLRANKENPTTRPSTGSIDGLGGLIDGIGIDRDLRRHAPPRENPSSSTPPVQKTIKLGPGT